MVRKLRQGDEESWWGKGVRHAVGIREARYLSRNAARVLSSCLFGSVMISERVMRVLESIESRSRFLMMVLLLSTYTATVWTDNSTGSGE